VSQRPQIAHLKVRIRLNLDSALPDATYETEHLPQYFLARIADLGILLMSATVTVAHLIHEIRPFPWSKVWLEHCCLARYHAVSGLGRVEKHPMISLLFAKSTLKHGGKHLDVNCSHSSA
jgi:hypothetical protein